MICKEASESPLKKYLEDTGQTAVDFHRKTGIRLATIYSILHGIKPRRSTVRLICAKSKWVLKMKDFGYDSKI